MSEERKEQKRRCGKKERGGREKRGRRKKSVIVEGRERKRWLREESE